MSFKKRVPLLFFIGTFIAWFASLLLVYLPVSGWGEPTFPPIVNPDMLKIFLVATALSCGASLFMGISELKNWSFLKGKTRHSFESIENIET